MSGTTIIMIIAAVVALFVFGIPLYVVRKRNKVAIENNSEPEQETSITAEVTPVNDGPQLTQQPVLSTGPITVDMGAPAEKPARKRRTAGTKTETTKETKRTTKKPAEKKAPARTRKKKDETQPVLSKEFAVKHGLKISDTEKKTTKKSSKKTTKAK